MDQQQLSSLLTQQLSSMTIAYVCWALVFSFIGMGYFAYGKKRSNFVLLICGVILMLYPYFIANTYWLVLVGAIFSVVPYFWRE